MAKILTAKNLAIKIIICLAILAVIMGLCALVGTEQISLKKAFAGPGQKPGDNIDYEILE